MEHLRGSEPEPAGRSWSGPVAVAGASGRTGVHVVAELLARDLPVRALVRNPARAAARLDGADPGRRADRQAPDGNAASDGVGARADGAFLVGSTLTLAGVGALQAAGALPWVVPGEESVLLQFYDSLPPWAQLAFGAWQASATLLGLVLPAAALAWWGRRGGAGRAVRAALAPYALVLLWQVLLEAAFTRVFFPNIVVLTGMLYTAHRVWQLRRSRRAFTASPTAQALPPGARRSMSALLAAGIVFWPLNLAFLLTTQLPRIIDL